MSNKDFKVKNKLQVAGITTSGPVVSDAYGNLDSTSSIATQYGGTGTTTSPTSGQILYSESGTNYAPATLAGLPGTYAVGNTASRPGSPSLGQIYSNTQTGYIEVYTSAGWSQLGVIPVAAATPTATDAGTNVAYGSGAASISFTPSSSGGLASSFTATSSPGSITGTGASSPVTVTGLTLGTSYTFTLVSSNGYGNSLATSPSNSITTTSVPQAPTIGTATDSATSSGGTVSLTFTAGATGGKSITNYKYSTDGTTYTALSPAQTTSPLTISGLSNGVSQTIRLKAVNSNGDSAASSASNSVTPTAFSATGGTTVTSGGYKYHTFTSSGTFQIISGSKNIEMLVVAGGAGGGGDAGSAGGGAGGLRSQTISGTTGSYTVTIGAGGAGGRQSRGTNGSTSSVSGNGMTAFNTSGGGGGATDYGYGQSFGLSGGSGGGEGRSGGTGNYASAPGSGNAGGYSPSEGNTGGYGATGSVYYVDGSQRGPVQYAGGGGGAGSTGGNAVATGSAYRGGNGGSGSSSFSAWGSATSTGHNVSGTYYYAGGGGANDPGGYYGAPVTTTFGTGGNGGGGNGGNNGPGEPQSGQSNTGGGGGGGANYLFSVGVGSGGSGIVIIRYTA